MKLVSERDTVGGKNTYLLNVRGNLLSALSTHVGVSHANLFIRKHAYYSSRPSFAAV